MSRAGTVAWVLRHEVRLAWRELISMLTAGRRRRMRTVLLGFAVFLLFMHGFAYQMVGTYDFPTGDPDKRLLVGLTGTLALAWSLMLSQATEAVTRAFYARADLDLILSSPFTAWRLFAVRIGAMTLTIMMMSLALTGPFINALAWRGGPHWLGAYVVVAVLAAMAVSVSIVLAAALFRSIGPKRTRLVAQIIAAVIGAAFIIGLQLAAILTYGTISRFAFLQSDLVMDVAPGTGSALWWPARAALGELPSLIAVVGLAALVFGATVWLYAPRFAGFVLAATGVSQAVKRRNGNAARFRNRSPAETLRRKELMLLRRDPWLVSQTLMQLLYLLPAAFFLWRNFSHRNGASTLIVPVLIMAAGQLGGALAWLAVSGEDAPDLIATAPVLAARALRAKTEAVMTGIALVFAPFIAALAVVAPWSALVAAVGIAIAAASTTWIQIWFRTQAKRAYFRWRQTSSRIATFAEALSSCCWAATGAMAATRSWFALAIGLFALAIVGGTRLISPARN